MTVTVQQLPGDAPLAPQQVSALNAVLPTLNPAQAAWLSGYLAGLGQLQTGVATAPTVKATIPLTVLYGSESGNAEACAAKAADAARAAGFKVTVADMADYPVAKLAREKNLLILVSTWGEGDPPERAVDFHSFVMSDAAPSLKGVNFAVFALGDTSYADFCLCGKQFDERLATLGARRVLNRVDADVDFEPPFAKWLEAVIPAISDAAGLNAPQISVLAPAMASVAPVEPFGKKRPFPAEVKQLIQLNGRGSAKQTCHIELSLEGSGLAYTPGDVAGIFPTNCPEVVDDLIQAVGLKAGDPVDLDGESLPLAEALATRFDITSVNVAFMKKYAEVAGNIQLTDFLNGDKEKLTAWLYGREIRDLLLEFPASSPLGASALTGLLRKMPPRLYSIASSLLAHPDEVHLTVGSVSYNAHGRLRKGVCSTYLCQRIAVGDTVPVYTHGNKNFKLPVDGSTPIIMVGPGTGIAPFRAFVEERAILGAAGRNWLFFGDQHFNSDFLYQLEWMDYLEKGVLTRMDVAFSRDTDHKIYVQHRMREKAADLWAWLQEGAHFYVCGDANRMAKDVHQALIDLHVQQGGLSTEAAEQAVKALQKAGRYQRDVY